MLSSLYALRTIERRTGGGGIGMALGRVHTTPWNEAKDAELVRLWSQGHTTAAIAKVLSKSGFSHTASSVAGRLSRLRRTKYPDLEKRPTVAPRFRTCKQVNRNNNCDNLVTLTKETVADRSLSEQKASAVLHQSSASWLTLTKLVDLAPNQCRWPLGDPRASDFGFCGAEVANPKRSKAPCYCPKHADMALLKPLAVSRKLEKIPFRSLQSPLNANERVR